MIINPTFLLKDPAIIQGLLNGEFIRHGGVIREAANGRIVRHLVEAPDLTNMLMNFPLNPLLSPAKIGVNAVGHGMTIHKLNRVGRQLDQVQRMLSPVLRLSQVAAGASVLNVGISAAGFAYMGFKLNQIQTSLGKMQQSMEAGFNAVDERLDVLSGQLAYLHLLVEQNQEGQKYIAQAINELHRTILIREIAELRAELINKARFNGASSIQSALKVASKVRMIMCDQALQIAPDLEPQKMLLSDVATQGWAVATATETHLLSEVGMFEEAQALLHSEIPKFKCKSEQWANNLLAKERSELNTAYRFTAPVFNQHISQERVDRIASIHECDRILSFEKQQEKIDDIAVEFEMPYASNLDRSWIHKQVAVAEFLDTHAELSARLETLLDFVNLCMKTNIKSSLEVLPTGDDEATWYILPHHDEDLEYCA